MAQERRRSKKWLWIGIGVVVLFLVIIGVIIGINQNHVKSNESNPETTVEEQKKSGEAQNQEGETSIEEVPKKVIQYTGEDPNKSEVLTGIVTYAGVTGGVLTIRTNIDQYLTEGTCDLILEQNGVNIYNSRVDILGDVSTSTCKGYDIPVSELRGGNVQIIINLTAGERGGVIRGEVEI